MSASTTTFTQNERVLCYHGPMIYEAKILKLDNWDVATGTAGPHFFVHYKGWKQTRVSVTLLPNDAQFLIPECRWDEWVPGARLLKYNETNLELAKTLKNASTASTSKSAHKSAYPNLWYPIACLTFFARERHWSGNWHRGDRFLSAERWSWYKEGTRRG
jgi:mortality factor 4-like protein 1